MRFSKAKFLAPVALALAVALLVLAGPFSRDARPAKAVGLAATIAVASDINPDGRHWDTFFSTGACIVTGVCFEKPIGVPYDIFGNPIPVGEFYIFAADDNVGTLPAGFIINAVIDLFQVPVLPGVPVIPTDTTTAPAVVWAGCSGVLNTPLAAYHPMCPGGTIGATAGASGVPTFGVLTAPGSLNFEITSKNGVIISKETGASFGTKVTCTDDGSSFFAGNGLAVVNANANACDNNEDTGEISVLVRFNSDVLNGVMIIAISDAQGLATTERVYGVRTMALFIGDLMNAEVPADGSAVAWVAYNCAETVEPCGRGITRLLVGPVIAGVPPGIGFDTIGLSDGTGPLDNAVRFTTNLGTFTNPSGADPVIGSCDGQEVSVIDGRWWGSAGTFIPGFPGPGFASALGRCDFDGAFNNVATIAFLGGFANIGGATSGRATISAQQGSVVPGAAQAALRTLNPTMQSQQPVLPLRTVSLVANRCNPVALTFQAGTPVSQVAAGVTPTAALVAIWKYIPATNSFVGFNPAAPAAPVSDYLVVGAILEVADVCVNAAATITMPGLGPS